MNYVERSQEVLSDDGFIQRIHETVFVGLKRCPKCGASVRSKELNIDDLPLEVRADYIDAGDDFYIVKCPKCGKSTRPHTTLEGAAAEWNTKS